MIEKKITRKVISRAPSKEAEGPVRAEEVPAKKEETQKTGETGSSRNELGRLKKVCSFCQSKTSPTYTDIVVLRKYLTDRAKIVARSKNNLCSRHQRVICKQIKYARHLSLLPFVPKV